MGVTATVPILPRAAVTPAHLRLDSVATTTGVLTATYQVAGLKN